MTIEQTLDRIATALEQQAEATQQQNTLLAALLERAGSTDGVAEAPATKTTRRSKKAEAETAAAAEPAPTPAPEPAAAEPAPAPTPEPVAAAEPAPAPTPAPAAAAGVPDVVAIQAFATGLASKVTPARVVELIKKTGSTNISSMNEAQRAGFWADLQALSAESDAAAALG